MLRPQPSYLTARCLHRVRQRFLCQQQVPSAGSRVLASSAAAGLSSWLRTRCSSSACRQRPGPEGLASSRGPPSCFLPVASAAGTSLSSRTASTGTDSFCRSKSQPRQRWIRELRRRHRCEHEMMCHQDSRRRCSRQRLRSRWLTGCLPRTDCLRHRAQNACSARLTADLKPDWACLEGSERPDSGWHSRWESSPSQLNMHKHRGLEMVACV